MMLNVGEAARQVGVSKRTLHYYDSIGLLKPGFIGENSYRYYTSDDMEKLSRIVLFRSLGMSVAEIKTVMNSPDLTEEEILLKQIELLKEETVQTIRLIRLTKIRLKRISDEKAEKSISSRE